MIVYLIRHGETEYNVKNVYYGHLECDLNEKGISQASKLKDTFNRINYDKIYASPLTRAAQTAQIISGGSKEIIYDDGLKELFFGDWEGMDYKYIEENDYVNYLNWKNDWKNARPSNGQSFMELYGQVSKAFDKIIAGNKQNDIAIVSHGGPLRIILSHVLGLKENGYWNFVLGQGVYSALEITDAHCTVLGINMSKGL